jgi:tetratricopeptide (TPR) repeat protein
VPRPLRRNLLEILIMTLTIGLLAIGAYSRNQVWNDEILLWTDSIEKSPNKARPYVNLGLAYLNSGDYKKAFEVTQKSIQLDPKTAAAYQNLSIIYEKWDNLEQAVRMGQKALELDRKNYVTYLTLGGIYLRSQQYEKAEEAYKTFIQIFPYFPETHNLLAAVYAAQRQFDKVIEALDGELRVNPLHSLAHLNLGQVYWHEFRNREKALYHLKIALMVDPFLPDRAKIRRLVQQIEASSSSVPSGKG